jgi:hypothetical protein
VLGHCLDLLEFAHLGGYGRGLASPVLPYLLYQGLQSLFVPRRNNYLGAPLGEAEGSLPSYAAGGVHQRHNLLPYRLKLHIHRSLCFLPFFADLLVASVSQRDHFGVLPGLPRVISRFFGLAAIN